MCPIFLSSIPILIVGLFLPALLISSLLLPRIAHAYDGGTTVVLGDVEGDAQRLWSFLKDNPAFTVNGQIMRLNPGYNFVFMGDATDRGPNSIEILRVLTGLKEHAISSGEPDRVTLIMGNRDINKLRFIRELSPEGLLQIPDALAAYLEQSKKDGAQWLLVRERELRTGEQLLTDPVVRLRYMLEKTMGAPNAFEHRRTELAATGKVISDFDVVQSMKGDLEPGALQARYLELAQLAHLDPKRRTLYVHGAITKENFGYVPGRAMPLTSTREWVRELNAWGKKMIQAGIRGLPEAAELIAYQAPVPGTRANQKSVVYGKYAEASETAHLISRELQLQMRQDDVDTVV